jgi:hypothetical protein
MLIEEKENASTIQRLTDRIAELEASLKSSTPLIVEDEIALLRSENEALKSAYSQLADTLKNEDFEVNINYTIFPTEIKIKDN